jgi:hypothetical protein
MSNQRSVSLIQASLSQLPLFWQARKNDWFYSALLVEIASTSQQHSKIAEHETGAAAEPAVRR